jgi:hypothetical protein
VTQETTTSPSGGARALPLARVFRGALWLLFAIVLLVPKLLSLRRRPPTWNVLRAVVALASVSLIIGAAIALRFAAFAGTFSILIATVLLLAAIVVAPERTRRSLDARMHELGALVVVNGGKYRPDKGVSVQVHLCVGADRVWVLDEALSVLFEAPFTLLQGARAEAIGEDWKLSLQSRDCGAELVYAGPFAEHFARVAESTVRSQLHRELPILR